MCVSVVDTVVDRTCRKWRFGGRVWGIVSAGHGVEAVEPRQTFSKVVNVVDSCLVPLGKSRPDTGEL